MKTSFSWSLIAICCATTFGESDARADVKLNPLFTDNMVLQRDVRIPFWGTATPGEEVRVLVGFQVARAIADAEGHWQTTLPAMEATARPFDVTIVGKNSAQLRNVVVGDVWVCGGQSNMEFTVSSVNNSAAEIASANFSNIRFFSTPYEMADTPKSETSGNWKVVAPRTVGALTAIGYFFGREINQKTGVPIGLLNTNWGGTDAESWMSREALQNNETLRPLLDRFAPSVVVTEAVQQEYEKKKADWLANTYLADSEPMPKTSRWKAPNFDDSNWKSMPLPGAWENTLKLNIDGAVWIRRVVDVPKSWAGRALKLSLGSVDDWDTTYFNGVRVGGVGAENPNSWQTPREYSIPGAQVKAGRNVIAVRIFDRWGGGGINGDLSEMNLAPVDDASATPIPLSGAWRYAIEFSRDSSNLPSEPVSPQSANLPGRPTVLYNAKIAPLLKFPIRGVLWYQGENNAGRAYQYREMLPALIDDWRANWNAQSGANRQFPFYIVQLANFSPRQPQPAPSAWAELREAQAMAAKNVAHSGLAVAIDVGDAVDIHPRDKQTVAHRLALLALAKNYGQGKIEYSGPQYRAMKIEKSAIRISFSHAAGLNFKGAPEGFQIAGADKKFVWAKARIDGGTLVVSSALVPNPIAVRYAWADNPAAPLYNAANLPAVPFRTDDWPGITVQNR